MSEEPKKIVCPNCGTRAIKEGSKIVCETCDATFELKKTGGAKVVELGRLDSFEQRLKRVESLLPGQDPPEPVTNDDNEDDSVLGPE